MVALLYPKCGADLGLSFIFEATLAIGRGPRDMNFHDLFLPLNTAVQILRFVCIETFKTRIDKTFHKNDFGGCLSSYFSNSSRSFPEDTFLRT